MQVTKDVHYSADLALDIYDPETSLAPGVMLIHGGGWFEGDKSKDTELASALCGAGYFVWEPNYRLAPRSPYPIALQDLEAAMTFILDAKYPFQRSKVAIMGTSAGGHLALSFAFDKHLPCVSWSGPTDLAAIYDQSSTDVRERAMAAYTVIAKQGQPDQGVLPNQQGADDTKLLTAVLTEVAGDVSKLSEASPISHVPANPAPVYLANSLAEFIPVSQATSIQQALARAGGDSTLHLVPGHAHAKGMTQQTFPGTLSFLARVLV